MNWRPENWENFYTKKLPEEITYQENRLLTVEETIFEAGADAMHKADVDWIREHTVMIAMNNAMSALLFSTQEDWKQFSGEEE